MRGRNLLSQILGAPKIEEDSDEEKESSWEKLLSIFMSYVDGEIEGPEELLREMSLERADQLLGHALKGYGISLENALEVLSEEEVGDTQSEEVKSILGAALNNVVEFAVASQYQAIKAVEGLLGDADEMDEEELEEIIAILESYDKRYANVENKDVEYAMMIAAQWVLMGASTMIMYMTQGDNRVRPWHLQYEGYTAPKSMFPTWLIPPIEHQCRCYLVEAGPNSKVDVLKDVVAEVVEEPVMADGFNRTFKESVCRGGRIFSEEHPYYTIDAADVELVRRTIEYVKEKLYGNSD